jgi:ubiquinone biosynthesis protein UbiJ
MYGMMRKTATMILVTGLLAGCAGLSDTQSTTAESTLVGTGAGAAVGAAEQRLQHVETAIQIQQRALQQEQELTRTARVPNHMRAMHAEIRQLERQRDVLEQRVQTLASIDARLAV